MKSDKLKKLILSLTQDVVFMYDGVCACINPYHEHKIEVGYDDNVKVYDNIDDVMNDSFYYGKSLQEIADKIDVL